MKNFEAGKTVKLTAEVTVVLGSVVENKLHPSGTQFDGPAVVVAAFLAGVPLTPFVKVVSLSDPSETEVTHRASAFPEFAAPTTDEAYADACYADDMAEPVRDRG